jgi:flavin reductase (DIM6/NTAB) family NADH-FMN oxidoreductase RutF
MTITLDPRELNGAQLTSLMNGLVAPRPIAWVSSLAPDGTPNLAAFSFFNAFSAAPFTIGVGPGSRRGVHKDSLRNIKQSGEFTGAVTEDLAARVNLTSVNEREIAGVTPRPAETVRPPLVADSRAGLECQVFTIVDLGESDAATNSLVIARVTRVHVAEKILRGDVDPAAIRLVGRTGSDLWCTTRDRFSLRRPTVEAAATGAGSDEADRLGPLFHVQEVSSR